MLAKTGTTQTITVDAPPEALWSVLHDPEFLARLLPKHSRVELITDGMAAVGSRWRIISEVGNQRRETLHEVVEAVPGERHVVRSESEDGVSTMATELRKSGGQTLMTVRGTMDWRPGWRTLPNRVMSALLSGPLTRRSLRELKRLIEAGGHRVPRRRR